MGSPIRNSDPNTNHKVKLNTLDEVPHFRDDEDKKKFIEYLYSYANMYSMNVFFYLFIDNDVTIYFFDEKGNISIFIQCIKACYCVWYNKKYHRKGTLYKDRFVDEVIDDEYMNKLMNEYTYINESINDGSLINTTLNSEIVLDEICNHFGFSREVLYASIMSNTDIASLAAFCLRHFSSLMHKNIVKILKCITVPMSSTLSLNGLKLIKNKYGSLYDRILMKIYLDKNNYKNAFA